MTGVAWFVRNVSQLGKPAEYRQSATAFLSEVPTGSSSSQPRRSSALRSVMHNKGANGECLKGYYEAHPFGFCPDNHWYL